MRYAPALSVLLDLIYPSRCIFCNQLIDSHIEHCLCLNCKDKIIINSPPFCKRCGIPIHNQCKNNDLCDKCTDDLFSFKQLWAAAIYKEEIKQLIHQFKYAKKRQLGNTLADVMIDFASRYIQMHKFDAIISVPLHWRKRHERTFNQSGILAQIIAAQFKMTYLKKCLKKTRLTPSQTTLPENKRKKSVVGTFELLKHVSVKDKSILIVDDVFTTGATLNECSKTLLKGGAKETSAFVLARGI